MSIRTPSNLELLLHCYYSNEPHPRLNALAIIDGIEYLRANDMIAASEHVVGVYDTTDKGVAYIKHLLQVPFPVATWVIPSGPE